MIEPNWIGGLVGGMMIGTAAVLLLLLNGRIAGISGILGGLLITKDKGERAWRGSFLIGLVAGAVIYSLIRGEIPVRMQVDTPFLIVGGLLVGVGTRLGSGCTSGHGVCGLARRSKRSFAATATFMLIAIVTVYVMKQVSP